MAVIADMAVVVAFHFHDHMSIELSGFHLENFSLGGSSLGSRYYVCTN